MMNRSLHFLDHSGPRACKKKLHVSSDQGVEAPTPYEAQDYARTVDVRFSNSSFATRLDMLRFLYPVVGFTGDQYEDHFIAGSSLNGPRGFQSQQRNMPESQECCVLQAPFLRRIPFTGGMLA